MTLPRKLSSRRKYCVLIGGSTSRGFCKKAEVASLAHEDDTPAATKRMVSIDFISNEGHGILPCRSFFALISRISAMRSRGDFPAGSAQFEGDAECV